MQSSGHGRSSRILLLLAGILPIFVYIMPDEKAKFDIRRFAQQAKAWTDLAVKLGIGLTVVSALALLFPRGESIELEYNVGAIWAQKDLIAPFSFPILRDEREYARDVEDAKKHVYLVFERDTTGTAQQISRLQKFSSALAGAVREWIEYRAHVRHHLLSAPSDSARFAQSAAKLDIPFTEREWETLALLSNANRLPEVLDDLVATAKEDFTVGFLDRNKNTIQPGQIALRKGTTEDIIPADRLYDKSDIIALLESHLHAKYKEDVVGIAYKIGITFITPNIKLNTAATAQAVAAATDAVPRTLGFVQENERIVSKHERITPDIKQKLESLRRARAERGPASDSAFQVVGTALHVAIVIMLFGIYLYLFRKQIFGNNRRLALIALLILLEGLFAYLTREIDTNAPIEYLIAVPAASMILTIVFDSRVGFYSTVIISFLVAGIRGNDYSVALASLVAGALSVYTVRDMQNRTQIFRSFGFILLGYGLSIVALGLERFASIGVIAEQLSLCAVNAVISPVLTYGLLIFFERVFKVTTDLTLMELAHFNHPLLRMMAERAPGTYHHSISMSTLAEAAAASVGADETLARVGAYFHDIGKILKPTYFVENQRGSRNRHDRLSPRMSSLIIAAHVKDGVALANEYHLPQEVIDFIPMHHGTTRIDYFYSKALQLAHDSNDETKIDEINEQDYRYPGPKPQTKETGIMMLADTIEAAVRTIDDPSPQKLEAAIDELVRKRFEEGELDECPLTLKDLTKIKAAFLGVLVGVYHSRVKYPSLAKKRRRKTPAGAEPPSVPPEPSPAPPPVEEGNA